MRIAVVAAVFVLAGGCVTVPGLNSPPPVEDGGAVTPSDGGIFDGGPAPVDGAPPVVTITAPTEGQSFVSTVSTVSVTGTASDDVGLAAVQVRVGPNAWVAAATDDFFRTWRATLPLPTGTFAVSARATDASGKQSEVQVTVTRAAAAADASDPTLVILRPADGTETTRQGVVVEGTAADDTGIAKVETRVDGLTSYVAAETSDTFATWRQTVGVAPGQENVIRVRATDLAGKTIEKTLRVTSLTAADGEPPKLQVSSPTDGASVATETVGVSGTASDNLGVAKVEVQVGDQPFVAATSSDAFATWQATVGLATGANQLRVRATDVSGLETVVTLTVTSTFTPLWDPSRDYELRLAAPRDRSVSLVLDKQGLGEVIPESVRRSIVLLNLDPTSLMTSTMETIKNSCGSGWWNRNFNPQCPAGWGQAERNLWSLLTMTCANVNVVGTSIEDLENLTALLADFGILDDFSVILANALGLPNTVTEIVDTANAVAALKDDLIKTHPNVNADGTFPVTIEDGFNDMSELATRYGPQGSHPGFLDPSSPTFSKVLLDSFQMSVQGESNLTWYDGVDLSVGKEYIAILPSPSSDVITFDFTNTMEVTGLAANPKVDLAFVIKEYNGFLRAYTPPGDQEASNGATPPAHPGIGQAWSVDKWFMEYILVDASYRKYQTRAPYVENYVDPIFSGRIAVVTVGDNDNHNPNKDPHLPVLSNLPRGWARFWTLLGFGSPPKAQYLWEMIAEISQIRLRDGGVAEGQGSTRFVLTGLPVGLTGQQIIDKMRPSMEAQKSVLASRLLGEYQRNNGAVDFYLWGTSGNLYLFFIHASDPRTAPAGTPLPAPYNYTKPGFFSDEALTQKVSSTASLGSGDAVHEKIQVDGTARTVYVQDSEGVVYRLEIQPAQSDRVTLRVSRRR